jgi:hypothetical protein
MRKSFSGLVEDNVCLSDSFSDSGTRIPKVPFLSAAAGKSMGKLELSHGSSVLVQWAQKPLQCLAVLEWL